MVTVLGLSVVGGRTVGLSVIGVGVVGFDVVGVEVVGLLAMVISTHVCPTVAQLVTVGATVGVRAAAAVAGARRDG